MITAIFNNKMDSTVAYGLWQWDYGQVLRIKGIDFSQFAIEIHFSFNEDDEDSTIAVGVVKEVEYESTILDDGETKVTSETIQVLDVTIPKDFLWNRNKKNYTIYVFLHLSNEEIGHTVKKILLPVKIKARPTYPHASEDEALFHSTLEQINELAETTVENAKMAKSYAVGNTGVREGEDTDNAKYYAEQASASLEEATLQAENAEQSANNAKEYEENAELSANKAKEYELSSKTNADNAQGYMDWAYEYKDNAQEYSISARDYRDEAESAKNISLQASIDTGKVRDEVKGIQTDVKNIQTQINNIANSVDNTVIEINGLVEQVETNAETVATNTEITNQNKIATDEAKTTAEEVLASSRQINADVLEIKNQIMGFADDATRIVDEGIAEHDTSSTAHDDIRQLIVGLNDRLNTVLNSDDETLDQLSEIVDYIKDNRDLIETITSSKVNVSDIIDNLTTMSSNKPLSAKQGKILKDLIDAIKIPTKVSAFENDKGYLTEHQSLDEYVKNTDYATADKGGVVKASAAYGLAMNTSGFISTVPAPKIFIKSGEEQFKPITPRHQHESIFYGLAKAAGDTTQSASDNAVGTYTDEAKTKIKSMLGVPNKVSELTNDSGYLTEQAQSNWTETDNTSVSYLQNKPSIASGTGKDSIIEGCISGNGANKATVNYAHTEGFNNESSGLASHSEGMGNVSSGWGSHTEGNGNVANGYYAHAEGGKTQATQRCAHSEGLFTIASAEAQHVEGKYNIEDTNGTYAHIVGNGTDESARSNAHTLDWSGNAWYSGKVTADGTPTNDNDLVSKKWVEDKGYLTEQAQANWTETDNTSASYVRNKPSIASGTGAGSIIEGYITGDRANVASGKYAHAEGEYTTASVQAAHAEGVTTTASNRASHAEGAQTTASGPASHAEGYKCVSEGGYAHSEGQHAKAKAHISHAEGISTIASSLAQHVQGQYNVLDTEGGLSAQGRYAHIVGNGTADDNRSNAHTLDWSGNAWYAGKVTAEGTPTESNDLVPKSYVDGTLTDYVKNTDYATTDKSGVVKVEPANGIRIYADTGKLAIMPATTSLIVQGTDAVRPITPHNQHFSVFYGLAKASGDTTQINAPQDGTYTDEAKASIQEMLDVPSTKQLEDYTTLNTFYDDVINNTTNGDNIVSFNDGANNLPIQDLTINIEPNQDLHGYDSPWASGGGANLRSGLDFANDVKGRIASAVIDETEKTVSFAYNDAQTTDHFPNIAYKENTQYTLFIVGKNPTIARSNLRLYYMDGTYTNIPDFSAVDTKETKLIVSDANKTIASLAKTSNGGTTVLYYDECGVFEGVLTADQFTPYSNICPISGWTESNVVACGKNLFDKDAVEAGYIDNLDGEVKGQTASLNYICSDWITVNGGSQYYVKTTQTSAMWGAWYDKNKAFVSGLTNYANAVVTAPQNARYVRLTVARSNTGDVNTFAVNFPATATEYEPYHGTPITVSFGQTVYGGVLDVLTGKLSINRLLYKGGWEKYNENENYNMYQQTFTLASQTPKHMSNVIGKFGTFVSSTVSENIIQPPSSTGARGFMALRKDLSADDVEYSFVMATPIEIQLDPHTLNTLLGYNNIYTDVNGNISITYKANTKAYVDNKVMDNVPDLTSYVKNTDYATTTVGGVIKVSGTYGSGINSNGILYIYKASDAEVKAGTDSYKPITPNSQHRSVFYGLAKASGDTTQASSANTIGVYTNDAKTKIKSMIGVPTKISDLTNDSGYLTTETQSDWTETDDTSAGYIANKPSIMSGTTGKDSVIEGALTGNMKNTASGIYAHSEGAMNISSGLASHTEGVGNTASGSDSHAEGIGNVSSGPYSHSEGSNTIASSRMQHVQGKYNVEDSDNIYAHIVGNGTDGDNRSNAHTLDWDGNAWFAGKITVEGTPTEDNDVVTKGFIDTSYKADVQKCIDNKLNVDGIAHRTASIFCGQVDSTSTSTKFTATIDGITEYFDGLTILLKNGFVASATGCTIDINGLGAKGMWGSYDLTRVATAFTVTRIYIFVYDSALDDGNGGWWMYQGKDTNDNSVGYCIRTTYKSLPVSSTTYGYRLLFTSADKTHYVPANNSTSTNATAKRDVNQEKIDPFGDIVYYSSTAALSAEDRPSVGLQWSQYCFALGYSFNRTGKALEFEPWKPIYVKATPYVDGSAIIDADEPITQDLSTIEDGKIYIYLGVMYNTYAVELSLHHPVYYCYNGAIRPWLGFTDSEHAQDIVSSVNGKTGTVTLTAEDLGAMTGMTILSYGHSTWDEFEEAYNANRIVYCKASSAANPATGTQGRMAFFAYYASGQAEFQYYRSTPTHTDAQQGDQVFCYTLRSTNGGTWSVETRQASSRVIAGTGLASAYTKDKLTLSLDADYKDKIDTLWTDYQSALIALDGGE